MRIRKSPTERVPRRENIVQDWHDDSPPNHRVLTWGGGLGVSKDTPQHTSLLTDLPEVQEIIVRKSTDEK